MPYSTVTLTGTYQLVDGSPAAGQVIIIPSEDVILDAAGNKVLAGRQTVRLDELGHFSVVLPATDDTSLNPTGFGYTIAARLNHTHLAAVSFQLPAATPTVDMADVTPVDPSTFDPDATYVSQSDLEGYIAQPDAPTDGQALVWDDTAGEWVPGAAGADDSGVAAFVADEQSETRAALSSTYALATEQELDLLALRAQSARRASFVARLDTLGLGLFNLTNGLALNGDWIAATTGGTTATGHMSRLADLLRYSFRLKVTKATAGSVSFVGVNRGDYNTPHASHRFGFGYQQGNGLAFNNAGNFRAAEVPDANLTDGDEYDVSLLVDFRINPENPFGAGGREARITASWRNAADGSNAGNQYLIINLGLFEPLNTIAVVTNVAAGSITDLRITSPASGPSGNETQAIVRYSESSGEEVMFRVPAEPNGLAIICCHGHGASIYSFGRDDSTIGGLWRALLNAGYTLAFPSMDGNAWGNPKAQGLLQTLHGHLTHAFRLDPRIFMIGASMGGGAVLTAVSDGIIPIRAARVIDSVCDLREMWDNPSYSTILDAYPTEADMEASNPIQRPAGAYARVPVMFSASTADTAVVKVEHTDPMVAHLGGVSRDVVSRTTSGTHMTAPNVLPLETVQFLGIKL